MKTISCELKPSPRTRAARSGAALIIVLAFVVLLTGLMVAFFSRTISDRQVANGSALQTKTDIFARGAVSTITGDLKQEIAAGSLAPPNPAPPVPFYLPTSANGRQASQPYVFPDTTGGSVLIKRSANSKPFFPDGATNPSYLASDKYPASNRAAPVSTSKSSTNGRVMTADRWNKPRLFTDPNATSSGFPTAMIPDWIIVSSSPPISSSPNDFNPKTITADKNAVGRFAYTMYDESALLDANAAGGAGLFTPELAGKKGNLCMADLIQVSLSDKQVKALVGWRSGASAQATGTLSGGYNISSPSDTPSPTSLYNILTQSGYTLTNMNGFMSVGTLPAGITPTTQTDRIFTSRQQLLRFLTQGMPTDGLTPLQLKNLAANLGTFTREVNAPSWMPPKRPSNSSVDYENLAASPNPITSTAINRDATSVLVTKTFQRDSDGTQAVVNEPLIKHRFPLYRLGWFNNPAANASKIQKYFCMKQSTTTDLIGQWEYYDPDTGAKVTGLPTIKKLSDVAADGKREPTFWEVLQAAILSGSLGAGVTQAGNINNYWYDMTSDPKSVRSILRIGLCLIDQYDTDDDPTVLTLSSSPPNQIHNGTVATEMMIAGDENLPGLYMFGQQIFPDNITPITGGLNRYTDGYYQFLLWNPHRAADTANINAKNKTGSDAVKFAIRADGQTHIQVGVVGGTAAQGNPSASPTLTYISTPMVFNTSTSGVQRRVFDTMDYIKASDLVMAETNPWAVFPCVLPIAGGTAPTGNGVSAGQVKSAGFIQGQMTFPKAATSNNGRPIPTAMTYTLGKYNATGQWVPYLMLPRITGSFGDTGNANGGQGYTLEGDSMANGTFYTQIPVVTRSDPRTSRFGWGNGGAGVAQDLREKGVPAWNFLKADGTGTVVGPNPGSPIVNLESVGFALNLTGGGYYKDPDSVNRHGDGALVSSSTPSVSLTQGNPFSLSSPSSPQQNDNARPTVLNRPFTSVAEMGYAFRDSPWHSLNFFSADSADAGLLDFFTLNEESPVRAGVFNLNNATQPAMAALLCGAYLELIATSTSNPALKSNKNLDEVASVGAKSKAMAAAIRKYLGPIGAPAHVISNVADLPALNEGIASDPTAFPSGLKAQREVLARAFGDVTDTRTWNLLIDVVAQTGRYGPSARTADQFNVEGEKRLWVHLAIDRFTGQVIDSQVESVTE